MNSRSFAVTAAFCAAIAPEVGATQYCGRSHAELTAGIGRPYNAIGLLSNGCTAFLVGPRHIAAAGHCFVDGMGAWQANLHFYPNFHPSRVAADRDHVPRARVMRAVVGSRTGESVLGAGIDWGVARIDSFQDAAGLDLTPVPLSHSIPAVGTPIENPSYMRHHFPYDDNDTQAWDNMTFDTADCARFSPTGGIWTIAAGQAPHIVPGSAGQPGVPDQQWCNARWGSGFVNRDCSVKASGGNYVMNNCNTAGGSSGAPMLFRDADNAGAWTVLGLTHGGGTNNWERNAPPADVPTCADPNDSQRWDNGGPASVRFAQAPRFAANIAVHRNPGNAKSTAVFAVDSDTNQVVYRSRMGAQPTYTSPFSFWFSLGSPLKGSNLSRLAACSLGNTTDPQIFVVANGNRIFTRSSSSTGWTRRWNSVRLPAGVTSVLDLDATTGTKGECMLLMVDGNGSVFSRSMPAGYAGTWVRVMSGSHRAVSGLRVGTGIWAATVDSSGEVWRTRLSGGVWSRPIRLPHPAGVGPWRDIDFTWDEFGRGFMLAIPENGDNRLHFLPLYGTGAWTGWRHFDTRLWAPGVSNPAAVPRMLSVTASRWMEDTPGVTSPVIFATDDSGNVYFVEFARVGTVGWNLDWKSFYHETIAYP
jgi:hypothetical protein